MSDVNVAFPDSLSVDLTRVYKGRNGSLGNGILKRFNLFFDYTRGKLYLKKNKYFKQSFTYNNSGVVLEHNGSKFVREAIKLPSLGYFDKNRDAVEIDLFVNYIMALKPTYRIVEVRPTSNAYDVGLRPGDILIGFNGKESYNYSLAEINEVLHGKIGRNVFMEIERKGKFMRFRFKLDDVFKKNERLN